MELLLILLYVSICYVVFKVFRIPINQWSRCDLHLSNCRFPAGDAMAASRLRAEEIPGGASP